MMREQIAKVQKTCTASGCGKYRVFLSNKKTAAKGFVES